MSYEDMKAELEQLRKENAALKKEVASGIRLKVSGKGAVSVYGSSISCREQRAIKRKGSLKVSLLLALGFEATSVACCRISALCQ